MKKVFDDSLWAMLMVFALFVALAEYKPEKEETMGKKVSLFLLILANLLLFFTMAYKIHTVNVNKDSVWQEAVDRGHAEKFTSSEGFDYFKWKD